MPKVQKSKLQNHASTQKEIHLSQDLVKLLSFSLNQITRSFQLAQQQFKQNQTRLPLDWATVHIEETLHYQLHTRNQATILLRLT